MSYICRVTGVPQTQYYSEDVGKTRQSEKDSCDINLIVAKARETGFVGHVNRATGHFGVHTGIDFREAMQAIGEAYDAFGELPAEVRRRFDNDPATLIDFIDNPDNLEEAVELGLMDAPAPPPDTGRKRKPKAAQPTPPEGGDPPASSSDGEPST